MAGSYSHCEDDQTGKFRFDLIENLGDAHEACEEMFWMIHYLASGNKDRIMEACDAYYRAPRRSDDEWGRELPFPDTIWTDGTSIP